MARLEWDKISEKLYETGVQDVILFVTNADGYENGVAWNGVTSVNENPSGADVTDLWADNHKYLSLRAAETYAATIEAYTYPEEFEVCDGSATLTPGVTVGQQTRKPFGLCYRTEVGNDTEFDDYGYKLHIIYRATAAPSGKDHGTTNDSPEAVTMSWELNADTVKMPNGLKPSATLVIDSTKFKTEAEKAKLKAVEDMLYGTESTESKLPSPEEIMAALASA